MDVFFPDTHPSYAPSSCDPMTTTGGLNPPANIIGARIECYFWIVRVPTGDVFAMRGAVMASGHYRWIKSTG
jgi:hypothetical protein